jgi:hypothetical protein
MRKRILTPSFEPLTATSSSKFPKIRKTDKPVEVIPDFCYNESPGSIDPGLHVAVPYFGAAEGEKKDKKRKVPGGDLLSHGYTPQYHRRWRA